MLSTLNQVPTFDFDPLWADNGQDNPDASASPPTPQSTYFNMHTDWMNNSSSWPESMFGDKSFLSLNIEAYSPLDGEAPWNPIEGDFSLGYHQPMISSNETMMSGSYADYKNPTKTEVNGFSLSWPPNKQSSAIQSSWTESHPIKHTRMEGKFEQGVAPKYEAVAEHCSTDEDSAQDKATLGSPKSRGAKVSRPKPIKRETAGITKDRKSSHKRTKSNPNVKSTSRFSSVSGPTTSSDMRTNHNMIEKQYRNRLNLQFESLLEILPKAGDDEKRVGKAEVLTNANRYIQELERNIKDLEEKNVGLEDNVRDLTKRWVVSGGDEPPRNQNSIY